MLNLEKNRVAFGTPPVTAGIVQEDPVVTEDQEKNTGTVTRTGIFEKPRNEANSSSGIINSVIGTATGTHNGTEPDIGQNNVV